MQSLLINNYGIMVSEQNKLQVNTLFQLDDHFYKIVDVTNIESELLAELVFLTSQLYNTQLRSISKFVPSLKGEIIVRMAERQYCLIVNEIIENVSAEQLPILLATLHYYGRQIREPIKRISRLGQWNKLWEQRLLQIEQVWQDSLTEAPENDFMKLFSYSFPYYMGLAENALQYLADTEIDDQPSAIDNGTVCQRRFSNKLWGDNYLLINPFEWVFDHYSRDLAEWSRNCYFQNKQTYEPLLASFFSTYESITELSSFSWRLTFARLLFPLHYFECIENYYLATSDYEKQLLTESLQLMVEQTSGYEQFLKYFYERASISVPNSSIQPVEWLYNY